MYVCRFIVCGFVLVGMGWMVRYGRSLSALTFSLGSGYMGSCLLSFFLFSLPCSPLLFPARPPFLSPPLLTLPIPIHPNPSQSPPFHRIMHIKPNPVSTYTNHHHHRLTSPHLSGHPPRNSSAATDPKKSQTIKKATHTPSQAKCLGPQIPIPHLPTPIPKAHIRTVHTVHT